MMKQVNLIDICNPKQWKTISTSDFLDEGYPVYGANGKIGFYSEYTHEFPTVLITCRGATCGTINICEPKSYVNGNAMALDDLDSSVDLTYLFYVLNFRGFDDAISGSAQPQITRQNLKNVKIPLPPLAEQQKIAAILDAADSLRQKDQQLVERYTALSQSLFLEMFGDPVTNPKEWAISNLEECLNGITGGTSVGGEERNIKVGEKAVLKISAVTSGSFDPMQYKVVEMQDIPENPINPQKGDLLFSRANTRDLVGATCIVDKTYENFFLPDKLWRLDLKPVKASNRYIKFLLTHDGFRENLRKVATGTSGSMLNISKAKLQQLKIPLPPISLQNQFAERIQLIEAHKQQAQRSLEKSEALFNSLLQRAFTGELTAKMAA